MFSGKVIKTYTSEEYDESYFNVINEIDGEEKVFEPYKHYVSNYVYEGVSFYNQGATDVINNIPDGYEVYSIYTVTDRTGETQGYVICFFYNEIVMVNLSDNDGKKGYYNFGTIYQVFKFKKINIRKLIYLMIDFFKIIKYIKI